MTAMPRKTEPIPENVWQFAGYSIRKGGFWALLIVAVGVLYLDGKAQSREMYQAAESRAEIVQKILESNSQVLRDNARVMEELQKAWSAHDRTAQDFIRDLKQDIDQIKNSTSKIQ